MYWESISLTRKGWDMSAPAIKVPTKAAKATSASDTPRPSAHSSAGGSGSNTKG